MPEISRFFGIVVRMFFDDHPPPHFHAEYAGVWARIAIQPMEVMSSDLPPRALSMVLEWGALHQRELLENWDRLQNRATPRKIAPLR